MEKFFEEFITVMTGGTIYNIIILLFAIIGLIASFYFYKKSHRLTSAAYMIRTIRLINNKINKFSALNIECGEDSLNSLSISKVALWNDGSDTINADSIAKNNTLRIEIDKRYQILGADIQYAKNKSNDFKITISPDKRCVKIDFDYFDRDEGAVIQLYHTGRQSADLAVVGQIKACREIRRFKPYSAAPMPMPDFKLIEQIKINKFEYKLSGYKWMIIYGWIIVAIALWMFFYGMREIWYTPAVVVPSDPFAESLWVIFFCTIYGFVGYQVVKRRIPKGFDVFNEEF